MVRGGTSKKSLLAWPLCCASTQLQCVQQLTRNDNPGLPLPQQVTASHQICPSTTSNTVCSRTERGSGAQAPASRHLHRGMHAARAHPASRICCLASERRTTLMVRMPLCLARAIMRRPSTEVAADCSSQPPSFTPDSRSRPTTVTGLICAHSPLCRQGAVLLHTTCLAQGGQRGWCTGSAACWRPSAGEGPAAYCLLRGTQVPLVCCAC